MTLDTIRKEKSWKAKGETVNKRLGNKRLIPTTYYKCRRRR